MTNTPTPAKGPAVMPADPAMAASDPAMFAPLTGDENQILRMHLTSGWYKQAVVYPGLSEPWKETSTALDDLHAAWQLSRQAEHEPEAGQ